MGVGGGGGRGLLDVLGHTPKVVRLGLAFTVYGLFPREKTRSLCVCAYVYVSVTVVSSPADPGPLDRVSWRTSPFPEVGLFSRVPCVPRVP